MSRLRISAVIPAYNEESMIGACLEAVLGQSRAADEVIVADNNSTDRTAGILPGFPDRVIVLHDGRQGVQHATHRRRHGLPLVLARKNPMSSAIEG